MQHVYNPQTAHRKGLSRRYAYRIAVGVGWNDRRIIDFYDCISIGVDVRELQGHGLRRGYETEMCKTRKRRQQRHAMIRTMLNRALGLAERAHTSRCRG